MKIISLPKTSVFLNAILSFWIQTFLTITPATGDTSEIPVSRDRHLVQLPTNSSQCWSSTSCKNSKQKPVCGTDGRTYASKCDLKKVRRCEGRKIRIQSLGRCPGPVKDVRRPSQCLEERRQTLFSISGSRIRSPGQYVPECLDDGSFSPVQCHQAAGYCWCVTPDGRPIPETSVQGTDVKCKDKGLGYKRDAVQRGRKTRRGLRGKSCSPTDRAQFNKNLVLIFSEEYTRDPTVDKSLKENRRSDSNVISWKFKQLDEDNDGLLRRGDIRTLKKMLKKVVKPRKCAKTFDTYCDLDQDRRLSREEWAVCLGGDLSRIIKSTSGHSSKMCSPTDRAAFNRKLIQSFMKEFESEGRETPSTDESQTAATSLQPDTILDTPERRIITWKFRQLDRDHDGRLRRDEIRTLKAQVKSSMKPKACAKTLDTHCDFNRDQFIMASEWSVCLGVDINNAPPGGSVVPIGRNHGNKGSGNHGNSAQKSMFNMLTSDTNTRSPASKREDTPLYEIVNEQQNRHLAPSREEESVLDSGCVNARAHFLREHEANPEAHIFVPECLENGQYRKEQCHNATGFCWCVDQKTGKPIPTTSTRNVMPNCTNVKIREFKGCSYPMRKQFLTKLLDQLTTEMMEYATDGTDKSPMLDTGTDLTLEERAVRWKLKMLDKNNNQKLERQELKHFKNVVRMKKDLRKCSRNFLRYCDENNDGSISIAEWIECTGINEQHRNLPENSHPRGINPFTVYLKGDQ